LITLFLVTGCHVSTVFEDKIEIDTCIYLLSLLPRVFTCVSHHNNVSCSAMSSAVAAAVVVVVFLFALNVIYN